MGEEGANVSQTEIIFTFVPIFSDIQFPDTSRRTVHLTLCFITF